MGIYYNKLVESAASIDPETVIQTPDDVGNDLDAIEKAKNFELYHGECVALGTVAAAYISWKKEMLSMEEFYEIRDMFVPFYLPISVDDIDPQEILKLTKSDKKMEAGKIKFILLKKIGKAVIDRTVTDDEILAAIEEINFSEEDAHE